MLARKGFITYYMDDNLTVKVRSMPGLAKGNGYHCEVKSKAVDHKSPDGRTEAKHGVYAGRLSFCGNNSRWENIIFFGISLLSFSGIVSRTTSFYHMRYQPKSALSKAK